MFFKLVLNLVTSAISISLSIQDKTVVVTTSGPIKGKLVNDLGVSFYAYQGIPYAESPTGSLRFKPPVPKSPWTKVRDATKEGSVCLQPEGFFKNNQMKEDCLYINIYIPANKTENELAVLAYIHSGQFTKNSGNAGHIYGPQLLLKRDIIIVTFNYRLGALGFLSLDIEGASGNAGLKDVLLALKWINANIGRFGGDKKRITLGGTSSGSAMAHYLSLSSKAVGLFNQLNLSSGAALGYRFLARHAKENALALGKHLKLQTHDTNELLERLTEVNPFEILQAQEDMGRNDLRKGFRPFAPFVPCVEIDYADAIITNDPRKSITTDITPNLPILAGFNTAEGLNMFPTITKNSQLVVNLDENFELCIPSDIEYPYGSEESRELARMIRESYFGGRSIFDCPMQNYVDLITDTMYSYSIDCSLKLHKDKDHTNVSYYYVFGFDGELNWNKLQNNITLPGAAHSDEYGYSFVTNATRIKLNNIDLRSEHMIHVWTTIISNFVKFGNPTQQKEDIGSIWLESGIERNYLFIGDSIENRCGPPRPRFHRFWYDVYDKYYRYLESGDRLESKIVP